MNAVIGARSGVVIPFYEWSTVKGFLGHTDSLLKPVLALDDYVAATRDRPNVIKVDVEGAEVDVVSGLASTLRAVRPTPFVELHTVEGPNNARAQAALILALLGAAGYCMIYLRTKKVVRDAADLGSRGRTHVLCLPDERPMPAALDSLDMRAL